MSHSAYKNQLYVRFCLSSHLTFHTFVHITFVSFAKGSSCPFKSAPSSLPTVFIPSLSPTEPHCFCSTPFASLRSPRANPRVLSTRSSSGPSPFKMATPPQQEVGPLVKATRQTLEHLGFTFYDEETDVLNNRELYV